MKYTIECNDIPIWSCSLGGSFYYLHRAMLKSPDGTETLGYVVFYWVWPLDFYPDFNLKPDGCLSWEVIYRSRFVLSRRPMPPANRHEVLEFAKVFPTLYGKPGTPLESTCLLI